MSASPKPDQLRNAIAQVLWHTSALETAQICDALGMPPQPEGAADPFASKVSYVRRRLIPCDLDRLIEIAQRVEDEYGDGELEIAENAEHCLVFDRPLGPDGGFQLPALVPQVYLHYDPYTKAELGPEGQVLGRQRMDFLMLFPDRSRVVIEIDGRQHYGSGQDYEKADPASYAEMVREDRSLRLRGYEVCRRRCRSSPQRLLRRPAGPSRVIEARACACDR